MPSIYSQPEVLELVSWAQAIKPSSIQHLLDLTAHPKIIPLGLGLPAAELFPAEAFARAATYLLEHDRSALQYQPAFQPLKAQIVTLMAQRGVACREEQIFLTAGAQQAMNLLTRLLLEPRGRVLVE